MIYIGIAICINCMNRSRPLQSNFEKLNITPNQSNSLHKTQCRIIFDINTTALPALKFNDQMKNEV